jgi:hypothetical protein
VLLMHRDGWLPLYTGAANLDGARIAVAIAVHVIAIGLPLIAVGFGSPTQNWHVAWLERHAAFARAWRDHIATWLPELARALDEDQPAGGRR